MNIVCPPFLHGEPAIEMDGRMGLPVEAGLGLLGMVCLPACLLACLPACLLMGGGHPPLYCTKTIAVTPPHPQPARNSTSQPCLPVPACSSAKAPTRPAGESFGILACENDFTDTARTAPPKAYITSILPIHRSDSESSLTPRERYLLVLPLHRLLSALPTAELPIRGLALDSSR
jgi:hypothetical protein